MSKLRFGGTLAAALALLVTACSSSSSSAGSTQNSSAPIAIGGVMGLTGALGAGCTPSASAYKTYFAYVNAHGGINGRKIQYTILDDGTEPSRAVTDTLQLIQQYHVQALFGACDSAGAVASIPLAEQYKIPMIGCGTSVQCFTPLRSGIYNTMPLTSQQDAAVLQYAFKARGVGTIATVNLTALDSSFVPTMTAVAQAAGTKDVANIQAAVTTTDWGPAVIQLEQAKPDYVVSFLSIPQSAALVLEMAREKYKPRLGIITAYGFLTPSYAQVTGAEGYGTLAPALTVALNNPQAAQCLKIEDPSGGPSNSDMLSACAQGQLLVSILKSAGPNVDAATINQALQQVKDLQTGVTPPMSYDPATHLIGSGIYVQEDQNGSYIEATPNPVTVPEPTF
jgi:branched-chain amino acid transport system substrate-binding protein